MAPDRKLDMFKGNDGDWWWRVTHRNGKIVAASSEGYRNRGDAVDNARAVLKPAIFETLTDAGEV